VFLMLKRVLVICLVFSLMSSSLVAGEWVFLGKRNVNRGLDKDTIHVGAKKGTFKKIKFKIKKSGINFHDVKVHFSDGSVFDVKLKAFIKAGGSTRTIDLPGKARNIKKVVFWYDTDGIKRGKGAVRLLGK